MNTIRRGGPGLTRRTGLFGVAGSLALMRDAAAETFPSRTVRLIVPFAAGGSTDVLARLMAEDLSPRLGQRVLVENRPGAGGNIAGEYVARAEPDGYTLLVAGQSILAINQALYKTLSYDPVGGFAYVGMLGASANVLTANPKVLPVANVTELLALARSKPGEISYGSNGPGSLTHLMTEVLAKRAGISLLHVPYRGAAPLMTDLLAGRIALCFTATTTALPYEQSGELRAIAVSTAERSKYFPKVATVAESGFPEIRSPTWFAIMAPAGTPAPVLARLRREIGAVSASPAYATLLDKHASDPMTMSLSESETFLAGERQLWSEAVKATGAIPG